MNRHILTIAPVLVTLTRNTLGMWPKTSIWGEYSVLFDSVHCPSSTNYLATMLTSHHGIVPLRHMKFILFLLT